MTYYLASPLNMTIVECSLGIICISVPPMRPLFKKLAPGFLASYITRHTGISRSRTGASKLFSETGGGSGEERVVRVKREVSVIVTLKEMDREVDRQLEEFEMSERKGERERGESRVGLVREEDEMETGTERETEVEGKGDRKGVARGDGAV